MRNGEAAALTGNVTGRQAGRQTQQREHTLRSGRFKPGEATVSNGAASDQWMGTVNSSMVAVKT